MSERIIDNEILEQISILTEKILSESVSAELYLQRGRLYWKLGKIGAAMSDYEKAASIDPNSPAKQVLYHAQEIMDFYNTDLYNP